MTTEPIITSERIDDFPLLLAVMLQLGLPAVSAIISNDTGCTKG